MSTSATNPEEIITTLYVGAGGGGDTIAAIMRSMIDTTSTTKYVLGAGYILSDYIDQLKKYFQDILIEIFVHSNTVQSQSVQSQTEQMLDDFIKFAEQVNSLKTLKQKKSSSTTNPSLPNTANPSTTTTTPKDMIKNLQDTLKNIKETNSEQLKPLEKVLNLLAMQYIDEAIVNKDKKPSNAIKEKTTLYNTFSTSTECDVTGIGLTSEKRYKSFYEEIRFAQTFAKGGNLEATVKGIKYTLPIANIFMFLSTDTFDKNVHLVERMYNTLHTFLRDNKIKKVVLMDFGADIFDFGKLSRDTAVLLCFLHLLSKKTDGIDFELSIEVYGPNVDGHGKVGVQDDDVVQKVIDRLEIFRNIGVMVNTPVNNSVKTPVNSAVNSAVNTFIQFIKELNETGSYKINDKGVLEAYGIIGPGRATGNFLEAFDIVHEKSNNRERIKNFFKQYIGERPEFSLKKRVEKKLSKEKFTNDEEKKEKTEEEEKKEKALINEELTILYNEAIKDNTFEKYARVYTYSINKSKIDSFKTELFKVERSTARNNYDTLNLILNKYFDKQYFETMLGTKNNSLDEYFKDIRNNDFMTEIMEHIERFEKQKIDYVYQSMPIFTKFVEGVVPYEPLISYPCTNGFTYILNHAAPFTSCYLEPNKATAGMSLVHLMAIPTRRIYNAVSLKHSDLRMLEDMQRIITEHFNGKDAISNRKAILIKIADKIKVAFEALIKSQTNEKLLLTFLLYENHHLCSLSKFEIDDGTFDDKILQNYSETRIEYYRLKTYTSIIQILTNMTNTYVKFLELSKKFVESDKVKFAFYFHVFPFQSVDHLHMHCILVDDKKTYQEETAFDIHNWKNTPVDIVTRVLKSEKHENTKLYNFPITKRQRPNPHGGKLTYKKTEKYAMIGKRKAVIYMGPRKREYVRINGEYVKYSPDNIQRMLKKKNKAAI